MAMEERTCAECGQPFMPTRTAGRPQIYCSRECYLAGDARKTAARKRAATAQVRTTRSTTCAECGRQFTQPMRGRPRRFCSDECKARMHNRRQNRSRLPLRDLNPQERFCAHCGDPFIPSRRDQIYCPTGSGKWCAQAAYHARQAAGEPLRQVEQQLNCQECGKEFTAFKSNARWCSLRCKNRNTGRVMSRRRTGDLSRTPYTDREIFERDGWVCSLCGKPVDPALPRTHWDGATIDHTIPVSLGGIDEPDNVTTAHWRCNHTKRARLGVAALT